VNGQGASGGPPNESGAGTGEGVEIPPEAAYRVTLPEFEGPLDLLLHLCKTHEIDILEIPISFITQKYLEYLEVMQSMSVELAAEYLVMAATLAYLKSRELVPTPEPLEQATEEGEEALDPREELIRRLLEYQKYKDAAGQLGGRPIEGRNVFVRGMPMDAVGDAGLAEHSVWKLIESWNKVLEKAAPKFTHEVVVDRMSISERINQLVDRLESGGGTFRFDTIIDLELPEIELRHQVVVTLLAVLELARLRVIRVLQDEASGDFYIAQREGAVLADARRARVTSDAQSVEEAEAESDGGASDAPAPPAAVAPETTDEAIEAELRGAEPELEFSDPELEAAEAELENAEAELETAESELEAAEAAPAEPQAQVADAQPETTEAPAPPEGAADGASAHRRPEGGDPDGTT
jgi:segregation and condensation protein A